MAETFDHVCERMGSTCISREGCEETYEYAVAVLDDIEQPWDAEENPTVGLAYQVVVLACRVRRLEEELAALRNKGWMEYASGLLNDPGPD